MAVMRDKWVHIKVAQEERDAWQAAAEAEGVTLADLIRSRMSTATVDREPRRRRAARRADPVLLAALARIGSNLNQIARWANTYKRVASVIPVMTTLVAVERAVRDVLTLHQGNPLSIAPNTATGATAPVGEPELEDGGNREGGPAILSLLPIQHGQASEQVDESC